MTAFTLVPKIVGLSDNMHRGSEALLWVGDRAFILPRSFFENPGHALRVDRVDADGRSHPVFSGNVETPSASGKTAYQLPGLTGLGWRVRVDGVALIPQPAKSTP